MAQNIENQPTMAENIRTTDLIDKKRLARGNFGVVYTARLPKKDLRVAIKEFHIGEEEGENWFDEVQTLQRVNHPYIVSILDFIYNNVQNRNEIWIIMEYVNGGSLRPYCTEDAYMSDAAKIEIGYQCWSALCYLHTEANITHKDLKPENILLSKVHEGHLEAKICDFGMARIRDDLATAKAMSLGGTPMYFPPEVASDSPPKIDSDLRRDVYSLAATLIELFTNKWFWHDAQNDDMADSKTVLALLIKINRTTIFVDSDTDFKINGKTIRNAVFALNIHYDDSVMNILKRAIRFNCDDRPPALEVMIKFRNALWRKRQHAQILV